MAAGGQEHVGLAGCSHQSSQQSIHWGTHWETGLAGCSSLERRAGALWDCRGPGPSRTAADCCPVRAGAELGCAGAQAGAAGKEAAEKGDWGAGGECEEAASGEAGWGEGCGDEQQVPVHVKG